MKQFIYCIGIAFFVAQANENTSQLIHSIGIGAIAGTAEGVTGVPCSFAKNVIQNGNSFNDVIHIIKNKPFSLYRGLGVNSAFMAPITAVQTMAQGIIAKSIEGKASPTAIAIISSIGAGVAAATIACPTERIMFVQQTSSAKSMISIIATLTQQEGIRGFGRGYIPTALRDGGFTCALFAGRDIDPTHGVIAGSIAAVITHPVDSIRSKMFASNVSMIQSAQHIAQRDGIAGLYKGGIFRTARIAMAIPMMGYVYDKIKGMIASVQ